MNDIKNRYRLRTWLLDNFLKVGLVSFLTVLLVVTGHLYPSLASFVASILLTLFIIKTSIVRVPSIHFGEYRVFDERTGDTVGEGLHWCWVWQRIHLHDASVKNIEIKESFTTLDEVEAKLKGTVQYRVDDKNAAKFADFSEDTIKKGLSDLVSSELGIIAGLHEYKSFIEDRETIQLIIDCILCLKKVPHHDFDEVREREALDEPDFQNLLADEKIEFTGNSIKPKSRIKFYNLFSEKIKALLKEELSNRNKNSAIESKYAIDIDHFALADVGWTDEFKKAMEEDKKAEAKVKAAEQTLKLIKKIGDLSDIPPTTALHAAMAITNNTSHQTIAVEGESGGVMPIIRPSIAAADDDD